MALENLVGPDKGLDALVITNPDGLDPKSEGDNHIRGEKNVLVNTFGPMQSAAVSLPVVGALLEWDGAKYIPVAPVPPVAAVLRGWIAGAQLSTAGSSGTFAVTAGQAADSTNATYLQIGAKSKTTANFVAGSGNGSLDTGSIAINTWYHAYAITSADGTLNDFVVSLNATSPALPSGYTRFRRIGSMKTNASSQWVKFFQTGDQFMLDVPVVDRAGAALTVNTPTTVTLASVPLGIVVTAITTQNITGATTTSGVAVYRVDQTDTVNAQQSLSASTGGAVGIITEMNTVNTNTAQQIKFQTNTTPCTLAVNTRGWIDRRGQDA